jgi:hypothetical protein
MSLASPATCTHNLEVAKAAPLQTLSHLRNDAQQGFTMQTAASPKIPTLEVSGEVSEFDVGPIRRLCSPRSHRETAMAE